MNTLFFFNIAGTYKVDNVNLNNSYEVDLSAVKIDNKPLGFLISKSII
jgi:hypothetical protein